MNFDINKHTHYLVIVGSHAYGMARPDSDIDIKGWCVPPHEYFYTFDKKFEQYDEACPIEKYSLKKPVETYIKLNSLNYPQEPLDQTIFNVTKFFKLAADCNPNIIELLFVDPNEILIETSLGKLVRENRDLFLSAKAKFTYSGYAISQLKRINLHRRYLLHPIEHKPTRAEYGLPEASLIPAEHRGAAETMINDHLRDWLLLDSDIDKTALALFHDKLTEFISSIINAKDMIVELHDMQDLTDAARIASMQAMGFDKNYIAVFQAEKKYHAALTDYKNYQSWKENRNPERAEMEKEFGYDSKHASHLVRLMLQCKELLTQGTLTVKRPDSQLLKDIRNGAWKYEELIDFASEMDNKLEELYVNKKYVIPHKPDMNKLSALCQIVVEIALNNTL